MASKTVWALAIFLGTFCISAFSDEDIDTPIPIDSAQIKAMFNDGDYWSAGSDGLDVLMKEPDNPELRLIVANSLAWSGRYIDAIIQYQKLKDTSLNKESALGLANIYRWGARPDLAKPYYQKVLALQPRNPDATDGLMRVNREFRPKTDVTFGRKSDSNQVSENSVLLKHNWRGDNLAHKYEVSINSSRYSFLGVYTPQTEFAIGLDFADLMMSPKLNLSFQKDPIIKGFSLLKLKLIDETPNLNMTLGHINWGNMAFQPQALLNGLVAQQFGLDGSLIMYPGTISANYSYFSVSDENYVRDSNLQFAPSWRPFGDDIKYYFGLSERYALKNIPTYWSPSKGFLSADIGFTKEWSLTEGEYAIYWQRGFYLGGEALNSFNFGFSAKRYLGNDWAASLSAGMLEHPRVGAYQSQYLSFGIERLW